MIESVAELLADPFKGRNRATGSVLTFLWRDLLIHKNMNMIAWGRAMRAYEKKPHIKAKGKLDVGNLNKRLIKDELLWPSFKEGIDLLNPLSATLSIHLKWANNRTSIYQVVIDPAEDEDDLVGSQEIEQSDIYKAMPSTKEPLSSLARLYRQIIAREQINQIQWQALLREQANHPLSGVEKTSKKISAWVASTQKELMQPRMSWNIFIRGLLVLKPKEVQFVLSMKWTRHERDTTHHHIAFPIYSALDNPPNP